MTTQESIRYVSFVFGHPELDDLVQGRLEMYEKYDGFIHYANLSQEGTLTGLVQLYAGDDAVAEVTDILDRDPRMVEYELDVSEGIQIYTHLNPLQWTKDLHTAVREHDIILNWPIEPTVASSLQVTILGPESELQDTIGGLSSKWDISIIRTGDYQSFSRASEPSLTAHQRKILTVAYNEGYYDVPKTTTQQELSAKLDLSTGTVAEHLRKIESEVFRSLVE